MIRSIVWECNRPCRASCAGPRCQQQAMLFCIPQGDGKHPTQVIQDVVAVLFLEMDQNFYPRGGFGNGGLASPWRSLRFPSGRSDLDHDGAMTRSSWKGWGGLGYAHHPPSRISVLVAWIWNCVISGSNQNGRVPGMVWVWYSAPAVCQSRQPRQRSGSCDHSCF